MVYYNYTLICVKRSAVKGWILRSATAVRLTYIIPKLLKRNQIIN
jgi:hypothetical protein